MQIKAYPEYSVNISASWNTRVIKSHRPGDKFVPSVVGFGHALRNKDETTIM